jgi:hypothetical protein
MEPAKQKRSQEFEARAECPVKHPRKNLFPVLNRSVKTCKNNSEAEAETEAKAEDLESSSLFGQSKKDIRTLYK